MTAKLNNMLFHRCSQDKEASHRGDSPGSGLTPSVRTLASTHCAMARTGL